MTGTTELTAALRAHARGLYCLEAAVELLINHASWLRRSDFAHRFTHTTLSLIDGTPMALIEWAEAITALDQGQLPCSGGEARILRLAASLADGIPVDLQGEAQSRLCRSGAWGVGWRRGGSRCGSRVVGCVGWFGGDRSRTGWCRGVAMR